MTAGEIHITGQVGPVPLVLIGGEAHGIMDGA